MIVSEVFIVLYFGIILNIFSYLIKNFFCSTYIGVPSSAWIDDYFDWSLDPHCCNLYENGTFCPREDDMIFSLDQYDGDETADYDFDYKAAEDADPGDYYYGDLNYMYDEQPWENKDASQDYTYGDLGITYDYDDADETSNNEQHTSPATDVGDKVLPGNTVFEDTDSPNDGKEESVTNWAKSSWNNFWGYVKGEESTEAPKSAALVQKKPKSSHEKLLHKNLGGEKHLDDGWPNNSKKLQNKHRSRRSPPLVSQVQHRRNKRSAEKCQKCNIKATDVNPTRPDLDEFDNYLPMFLKDNPDVQCPKAGHAAYGQVCYTLLKF